MRTVLFIPAWYPNKFFILGGIFVKNHAKCILNHSRVIVLHAKSDHTTNHTIIDIKENTEDGLIEIIYYYPKSVVSKIPGIALIINAFRFFICLFKGFFFIKSKYGKPDIIHVNILTRCGLVAYIIKKIYNIPYIITEHWSRYLPERNTYHGFFRHILTKLVVSNACIVSTVTKNLADAMKNAGLKNENYRVINNVADPSVFYPMKLNKGEKKTLLHISNLSESAKNVSGIIRVIKRLSEVREDFVLNIVGSTEVDAAMDHPAYAKELGVLNSVVFFKGTVVGQALVEEFNKSECLLIFSNYENFPVVITESWMCGIPVIATNVGGIAEHLNAENGILIEKNDEEALFQAIIKILDHGVMFDSEKIRKYAVSEFGNEAVSARIGSFYNECVNCK